MAEDGTATVSDPPSKAKLQPFVRLNLDVLFLALNPPQQSNDNGHYFSGSSSHRVAQGHPVKTKLEKLLPVIK